MIWFILIWSSLLILIFYYIGWRLIKPLSLKKSYKNSLWLILALVPISQPVSLMLREIPDSGFIKDLFGWFSFAGFGFFSLILAGLITRDIIFLGQFLFKKIKTRLARWRQAAGQSSAPFDPQRRLFLLNTSNIGIIGLSALLSSYGLYEARRQPYLEEIEIPIEGLPEIFNGFTIAQFTDLHVGPTIKQNFVRSVVNQVNELRADIIVFTGDLVDGSVADLAAEVAPLKDLEARHGVYFVTGNHEYYSGAEAWIEEADRLGMKVLVDANDLISEGSHQILLAGVTDYSAKNFIASHQSDPFKAIQTNGNPSAKILLAHQPKNIYKASQAGFDLQISGHTHGGQYIPWKYLVTLTQPYIEGLHRHGRTWIYVNRGTGYWGPPLRLGVPSEITKITLRSRAKRPILF